jgi:hypothetical protein
VRELDAVLNQRVLTAPDDASLDAAMLLKSDVKRRLVQRPDAALDAAARDLLDEVIRITQEGRD